MALVQLANSVARRQLAPALWTVARAGYATGGVTARKGVGETAAPLAGPDQACREQIQHQGRQP